MDLQSAMPILFTVALIGMMYLMIYLPQKKRDKKVAQMLSSLKEGNEVVTIGGIVGRIINVKDSELIIETSVEKTQLKITKWSVKDVVTEVK